jgi:hypothetical protein
MPGEYREVHFRESIRLEDYECKGGGRVNPWGNLSVA